MRYASVPTVSFTDSNNVTRAVKEMREIPYYPSSSTVQLSAGDMLDEVYSRDQIAGEGSEGDSYKIHEANVVAIVEARFDYSILKSARVPD